MAQAIGAGLITTTFSAGGAYVDVPDEIAADAARASSTDMPDIEHKVSSLTISIETIVMSAFIFIAILAWFEFIRTWFDTVFSTTGEHHFNVVYNRLWYAIFITALALVLIYIVYRIANKPD